MRTYGPTPRCTASRRFSPRTLRTAVTTGTVRAVNPFLSADGARASAAVPSDAAGREARYAVRRHRCATASIVLDARAAVAPTRSGRRRDSHLVVLEKIFASGGHKLILARVIHDFVSDDAGRGVRPMLVSVMTKVGDRSMRPGYQHLGDVLDRSADFAEELVLGSYGAAMLPGVVV